MPFVPLDIEVLVADNIRVKKETMRNLLEECQDRLGELPDDYSAFNTCEAVALRAPGDGPAPASDGTLAITFASRPLGDFGVSYVEIDGPITLTFAEHGAKCLVKTSDTATTLYLEVTTDRTTGVRKGFSCSVWRQPGSGDVQVVSSLTNAHLASHTRVEPGGVATIICDAERLVWRLAGETEL